MTPASQTPVAPARYLVTGCAGFIGAAVARLLLDQGHQVVGLDNLNDAYDPALKEWRLDRLRQTTGFLFHHLDVTRFDHLEPVFEMYCAVPLPRPTAPSDTPLPPSPLPHPPFSAVLHLAARAGVRPSVDNPWLYLETNVTGTLNLLELCRRHAVPKFVLASTSSLYGADAPVPYREDARANRPLSPYAASKKAAEVLAFSYHHLYPALDVSVLRYFTVYGPAGRPDMSVFRFIEQLRAGLPLTVYGDGSQSRDFTYVDDVARGTVAALRPCGFEIINLGGDSPVLLSSLIDRLGKLLGRVPAIEYHPAHPADVHATWADVSKARHLLKWSPSVTLDEGLRRTVDWHLADYTNPTRVSAGSTRPELVEGRQREARRPTPTSEEASFCRPPTTDQ